MAVLTALTSLCSAVATVAAPLQSADKAAQAVIPDR